MLQQSSKAGGDLSDMPTSVTTYYDSGDRTITPQQLTADANADVSSTLRTLMAASVGSKTALLLTKQSTGHEQVVATNAAPVSRDAQDVTGSKQHHRKMLRSRTTTFTDRTSLALDAARDAIYTEINSNRQSGVPTADKRAIVYARLAGKESARPADFSP